MTEQPLSFAEIPDHRPPAGPDLLSEMLKAVRLTGAVFLNARLTAPFGIIDPKSYGERTPMARLRHISILHLIVAGECDFETAGETCRVSAGDLIFLPLPGHYRFWKGTPERIALASENGLRLRRIVRVPPRAGVPDVADPTGGTDGGGQSRRA